MAEFTPQEWKRIHAELDANEERYGLPRRTYGSLVFASFNIRKLGSVRKRDEGTWQLLAAMQRAGVRRLVFSSSCAVWPSSTQGASCS